MHIVDAITDGRNAAGISQFYFSLALQINLVWQVKTPLFEKEQTAK